MPPASDAQLVQDIRNLIEQAPTAQEDAQSQGPHFQSWFSRAEAIVALLGPRAETFARRLTDVQDPAAYKIRLDDLAWRPQNRTPTTVVYRWAVDAGRGILDGLATALDGGLLTSIEDRVASEIYGDVLSEAEALLNARHLACAAILIRIDLESGLRRRARRESMPDADKSKASVVNDWLWKHEVYHKQTRRG